MPVFYVVSTSSSGHRRDILPILRTCKQLHQTCQRFLAPDFLAQNIFRFSDLGSDSAGNGKIRLGMTKIALKAVERVSCKAEDLFWLRFHCFAGHFSQIKPKAVTIFFRGKAQADKPSLYITSRYGFSLC